MRTQAEYVQLWRDIAECDVPYPTCCDYVENEQEVDLLSSLCFIQGIGIEKEDIDRARRVLDGYVFHEICDICLNYVMGGAE